MAINIYFENKGIHKGQGILMKTISVTLFLFFSVTLAALIGCNNSSDTPDNSGPPSQSANADHDEANHDHSDHDHGTKDDGMSDMEKMKKNLAKLSPEDAASAEKQHFCPVSDEMLGTMGVPVKVKVKDKDVWVCCDHCVDTIKEDPEKYLAKLKK